MRSASGLGICQAASEPAAWRRSCENSTLPPLILGTDLCSHARSANGRSPVCGGVGGAGSVGRCWICGGDLDFWFSDFGWRRVGDNPGATQFLDPAAFELSLRRGGRCGSGGPPAFQAI
jgi:hypothetical protein